MRDLRQSTAVTITLGPLTDSAGAVLASLTITKADVRLKKNGGDAAPASADQGASDVGAPYDELGAYDGSLDTTDTNTLGHLRVIVQESGQIVAWEDFNILPAQVWDSRYSTDLLQVDATQFAGQTITAAAGVTMPASVASPTNITAGVITTVTNLTNAPPDSAGTTTLLARLPAAFFAGITSLAEWLGLIAGKQVGNTTARTEIRATGAGSGTYDETTDSQEAIRDAGATTADIADAVWDEATAGHSTAGSTGKALTDAGSAGDPWSTALPGAYGAGTAGKILGDNLNATVSSRASQTSLDAVDDLLDTEIASIITSLGTIAGYLDTEVAAILEDTGTTLPAQIAALNNLSSAQAQTAAAAALTAYDPPTRAEATTDKDAILAAVAALNNLSDAEVLTQVNAALNTAISELGVGAPTATPTLRTGLMLLYMALRNRTTTTATEQTIQNNAGTVIATAPVSDDATTFTKGEFA